MQTNTQDPSVCRIRRRDYVLVTLLIALSGNPLFVYSTEWIYAIYVVLLILYLCVKRRLYFDRYVLWWLGGFVALFVAQYLFVSKVSIPADVNFIAKFLIAYLTIKTCGVKFCELYTRVMYVICFISLVCFVLFCIHIPIPGIEFDRYVSIGAWNYIVSTGEPLYRNSGMFWEPGAFQGFIMLPFLFYIGRLKWFWKNRRKQIIVLLLATLSTFSTTAYLVVFAYAFMLLMASKIRFIYKAVLVSLALAGAIYAYTSLEFLGDKIQEEVENSQKLRGNQISWTRTGAMIIEWKNLSRHPLTGNGFLLDSRYRGLGEKMSGAGNGLLGMANMLGIPMAIAYFWGVARSWRNTRRYYRFTVVVILAMMAFGEFFLNYPLYWGLLFVKPPLPVGKNQLPRKLR